MNKDFNDFLQENTRKGVQDNKVSPELDKSILNFVNKDLNPDHKVVLFKLTLIQGFIGLLTMLFCPQFNFSLTNNYDLFHYFHMNFGHAICMITCGCIFLGSGAIFASYILSQGEINKIKNSKFLYYTGVSIITVSCFMLLGADIYLNLLIYWLFGAIGGAVTLFELNLILRKSFAY